MDRVHPPAADLHADDLTWELEPLPRIEYVDLLTLSEAELFDYAHELQWHCEALRRVLVEALAMVSRLRGRVIQLTDRLRPWRKDPAR